MNSDPCLKGGQVCDHLVVWVVDDELGGVNCEVSLHSVYVSVARELKQIIGCFSVLECNSIAERRVGPVTEKEVRGNLISDASGD